MSIFEQSSAAHLETKCTQSLWFISYFSAMVLDIADLHIIKKQVSFPYITLSPKQQQVQ